MGTPSVGWIEQLHHVRLHVVTGKGGVGKTTAAAALALALATEGRRVLLVEVEGRQGIAQLFDTAPLPYAETSLIGSYLIVVRHLRDVANPLRADTVLQ